jgi:hypothetical protein
MADEPVPVQKENKHLGAVRKGFTADAQNMGDGKGFETTGEKAAYVAGNIAGRSARAAEAVGWGGLAAGKAAGKAALATGKALGGAYGAGKDALNKSKGQNPATGNKTGGGGGAGSSVSKGASSAVGGVGKAVSGVKQKLSGQQSQVGNTSEASVMPGMGGGGGSSADNLTRQLGGKTMSALMTIPELVVMLPIAVFFDATLLVLLILDFMGVGFGLSFVWSIIGTFVIGFWVVTRSFFRGVTKKIINDVSTGGQGTPAPSQSTGKKVAKKGFKVSLSVVRFLIFSIIKLIPFLGNLVPGFTLTVIFEAVQGEI